MSQLFRNRFKPDPNANRDTSTTQQSISASGDLQVTDGDLKFLGQQGGNNAPVAYQETSGAPVETRSPLGYAVGPLAIIFLNVNQMIGTGIFSTPATILKGTDSIGLSMILWFVGFLTSASSLAVYLEFASCFPSRSGAEVVYLEQAYPRPRWFFPTTFAVQTVILSFSSSNAVVMADYLFAIREYDASNWQAKGLAIGCYSFAVLIVLFHTRFSYWVSNGIGAVKIITLLFIAITGLVVLGGHTRVKDPTMHFKDSFAGTPTAYGVTNAMYKIIFSYSGYQNAFNVVNEVKNPVKTIRNYANSSLLIVTILYMLVNIAYFAAIPKESILHSKTIAASILFRSVFGNDGAVRGLNFLIALSAFGNLIAVLLGQSRVLRECGRQGVLPFTGFWVSTKPFGTPAGPYFVKWFLTIIIILAVPSGDAFNFVSDLGTYPASVFQVAMGVGLYVLRYRRSRLGLPVPSFQAWHILICFNILVQAYLVVLPWYPPVKKGKVDLDGGDVSFFYGTYIAVSIGIIIVCAIYYAAWIVWWPKYKGYRVRQELITLVDGVQSHRLVKVPLDRLETFDREHDANGLSYGRLNDELETTEVLVLRSKGAERSG